MGQQGLQVSSSNLAVTLEKYYVNNSRLILSPILKRQEPQIRIDRFACLRCGTKATPLLWNNERWFYRV
jgi:hypothetical protein